MSRSHTIELLAIGGAFGMLFTLWAVVLGLHGVTGAPITAQTAIERAKLFPTGSCSSDDWRTAWPARDGMHCLTEDQALARKPPVARWE